MRDWALEKTNCPSCPGLPEWTEESLPVCLAFSLHHPSLPWDLHALRKNSRAKGLQTGALLSLGSPYRRYVAPRQERGETATWEGAGFLWAQVGLPASLNWGAEFGIAIVVGPLLRCRSQQGWPPSSGQEDTGARAFLGCRDGLCTRLLLGPRFHVRLFLQVI